jgi:hypothetical protein
MGADALRGLQKWRLKLLSNYHIHWFCRKLEV